MADCIYPIGLLPHMKWIRGILSEAILKWNKAAIIGRRLDCTREQALTYDETTGKSKLRLSVIEDRRIVNLSTSLLGALHSVSDFRFRQQGNGTAPWFTGMPVDIHDYEENVDYCREDGPVCVSTWRIDELINFKVPYIPSFSNDDAFKQWKKSLPLTEAGKRVGEAMEKFRDLNDSRLNEDSKVYGHVEVNHDPTCLNYWHFTVDLYPPEDPEKPISKFQGAARRALVLQLKDWLCRNSYVWSIDEVYPEISGWESFCYND